MARDRRALSYVAFDQREADNVAVAQLCLANTESMPQEKHRPEEIVTKLRHVDVLVSQGP
jgi:hypothetical protein